MMVAVVRRAPVTVLVVGALWVVGAGTGSLWSGPPSALRVVVGSGVGPVGDGRLWTVLTSLPWCAQLLGYCATSVATLMLLPFAERRLGAARTVGAMLALQMVGVLGGAALVGLFSGGGRWITQLDRTMMLGPSAAVVGVVLLASAAFDRIWRRRVRLLLLCGLSMMALYSGMLGDLLRLGTGLLGLGAGAVTVGRRRNLRSELPRPSSRSETRVLVALLVVVSAIGPLIAALAQTRVGPLAVLRYVFTSPVPDATTVGQVCRNPTSVCLAAQTRLRLGGWGSAVMSVMPVVVALVSAVGLWRGRRVAWVAALALNVALGLAGFVLATNTVSRTGEQQLLLGTGVHVHAWLVLALPALQPLGVAAVLVATRRAFRLAAPPGVAAAAARTIALTFAGVAVVFVVGGEALQGGFTPVPDLGALLVDLPTRLLPPVYLGQLQPAFLPVSVAAQSLFEWTGPLFWATCCAVMLRVLLTDRPGPGDRERVQELTRRGGSTLAWMATWKGNAAWFTPDGRAGLAYRVIGGVALTVGGPIGEEAAAADAVHGFVGHCSEQGWTPALYSVVHEVAALVTLKGWSRVQVAQETLLPLAELSFTGRRWQDVRTAMNRARNAGIVARWTAYPAIPATVRDQVRALSAQWAAAKPLPEMGFTLGGVDEVDDPQVRLLLAMDAHERVLAMTSWLPVRTDNAVTGWTLDLMRRRADAPPGIMEFLIATAALDLRAEGAALLSLSGAPLARRPNDDVGVEGLLRLLDKLARRLEPVYGFGSLLAFKAKFQPVYRPLYLAYPDPVALPAIGNALARAYLPELGPRALTRLARAVLVSQPR